MFLFIIGVLYSIDKSQANTVTMQLICQLFKILFIKKTKEKRPSEIVSDGL